MYLVFTRMVGESYHRQLRSLLLYLHDIFQALINSLVCWFCTGALGLVLFPICDDVELNVLRCQVDILGANCDQCVSIVQCCFTSTETIRLIRMGSQGWPPQLSHTPELCRFVTISCCFKQSGAPTIRSLHRVLDHRTRVAVLHQLLPECPQRKGRSSVQAVWWLLPGGPALPWQCAPGGSGGDRAWSRIYACTCPVDLMSSISRLIPSLHFD